MKIKFYLVKLHNQILFQIIEQNESITSTGNNLTLYEDDEIYIASCHYPAFYESRNGVVKTVLYLRGFKKNDDYITLEKKFDNNEKRDEFYNLLLNKLKKI